MRFFRTPAGRKSGQKSTPSAQALGYTASVATNPRTGEEVSGTTWGLGYTNTPSGKPIGDFSARMIHEPGANWDADVEAPYDRTPAGRGTHIMDNPTADARMDQISKAAAYVGRTKAEKRAGKKAVRKGKPVSKQAVEALRGTAISTAKTRSDAIDDVVERERPTWDDSAPRPFMTPTPAESEVRDADVQKRRYKK